MFMRKFTGWLLILTMLFGQVTPVFAGTVLDKAKEVACPDFDFGKQIQKTCWDCFFPIVIFGVPIGGDTKKLPSDKAAPLCVCPGRSGYPSLGITLGYWSPDHVIETTRMSWCSPSLGGTVLSDDEMKGSDVGVTGTGSTNILPARWGGQDKQISGGDAGTDGISYYNFHWIKFPIAYIVGWLSGFVCSKGGNTGIDYVFMSEFDPSWNNDELAVWTSPETVLFTGPWSFIACAVDGVASTVSKPVKYAFWCGGTWGQVYPFSGNVPTAQSTPRDASLNALKGLAKMHRFTLAKKTYGDKAICMDTNYFILPKQQYRFQTLFPIAEKKDHWVGASTFRWGEWRNIPAKGEDYVWLQWTYRECCITFW